MTDTGKIEILLKPMNMPGDVVLERGSVVVTLVMTRDDGIEWSNEWGAGFTSWVDIEEVQAYVG